MQSIFWTSRIGPWSLRSIDKTGSPHLHDCNRLLLMGPWRNSKPQGPKRNIKWKLNHVSLGHLYPSSTSKIFEVKKMQCFKMQFWVIYSSKKYKLKKIQERIQVLNFLIHIFPPPTHCPPFLGVSFQKLFFSSLIFAEKGGILQPTLLFLLIFGW